MPLAPQDTAGQNRAARLAEAAHVAFEDQEAITSARPQGTSPPHVQGKAPGKGPRGAGPPGGGAASPKVASAGPLRSAVADVAPAAGSRTAGATASATNAPQNRGRTGPPGAVAGSSNRGAAGAQTAPVPVPASDAGAGSTSNAWGQAQRTGGYTHNARLEPKSIRGGGGGRPAAGQERHDAGSEHKSPRAGSGSPRGGSPPSPQLGSRQMQHPRDSPAAGASEQRAGAVPPSPQQGSRTVRAAPAPRHSQGQAAQGPAKARSGLVPKAEPVPAGAGRAAGKPQSPPSSPQVEARSIRGGGGTAPQAATAARSTGAASPPASPQTKSRTLPVKIGGTGQARPVSTLISYARGAGLAKEATAAARPPSPSPRGTEAGEVHQPGTGSPRAGSPRGAERTQSEAPPRRKGGYGRRHGFSEGEDTLLRMVAGMDEHLEVPGTGAAGDRSPSPVRQASPRRREASTEPSQATPGSPRSRQQPTGGPVGSAGLQGSATAEDNRGALARSQSPRGHDRRPASTRAATGGQPHDAPPPPSGTEVKRVASGRFPYPFDQPTGPSLSPGVPAGQSSTPLPSRRSQQPRQRGGLGPHAAAQQGPVQTEERQKAQQVLAAPQTPSGEGSMAPAGHVAEATHAPKPRAGGGGRSQSLQPQGRLAMPSQSRGTGRGDEGRTPVFGRHEDGGLRPPVASPLVAAPSLFDSDEERGLSDVEGHVDGFRPAGRGGGTRNPKSPHADEGRAKGASLPPTPGAGFRTPMPSSPGSAWRAPLASSQAGTPATAWRELSFDLTQVQLPPSPVPSGGVPSSRFISLLREKRGTVLRAWRLEFDPMGRGQCARAEFAQTCRRLGFQPGEGQLFWAMLRPDGSSAALRFHELDPEEAHNLQLLEEVLWEACGFDLDRAWAILDVGNRQSVTLEEFKAGLKKLGFTGNAKLLFMGLDSAGLGRLTRPDFDCVRRLSPALMQMSHSPALVSAFRGWVQEDLGSAHTLLSKLGLEEASSQIFTKDFASRVTGLGFRGDTHELAMMAAKSGSGTHVTAETLTRLLAGRRGRSPKLQHSGTPLLPQTGSTSPGTSTATPGPRSPGSHSGASGAGSPGTTIKQRADWNGSTFDFSAPNSERPAALRNYFSAPERDSREPREPREPRLAGGGITRKATGAGHSPRAASPVPPPAPPPPPPAEEPNPSARRRDAGSPRPNKPPGSRVRPGSPGQPTAPAPPEAPAATTPVAVACGRTAAAAPPAASTQEAVAPPRRELSPKSKTSHRVRPGELPDTNRQRGPSPTPIAVK